MTTIDKRYFREYRQLLGFPNQNLAKDFFKAKDIVANVDFDYIDLLNNRLIDIIKRINSIVVSKIKIENVDVFCDETINTTFEKLKSNNIIPLLNNQGRRPEEVYFSWMRGYAISAFFTKTLSQIFEVSIENIVIIGDDNIGNIENFKRSPKADLQINLKNGQILMVEVQSGFQGVNDIKQHKVLEAKKIKREENISSLVIHFDLYNGQVAFVNIDEIEEDSMNWITRINLDEGVVYNIDQNYFIWNIRKTIPKFSNIDFHQN